MSIYEVSLSRNTKLSLSNVILYSPEKKLQILPTPRPLIPAASVFPAGCFEVAFNLLKGKVLKLCLRLILVLDKSQKSTHNIVLLPNFYSLGGPL
jgi:hypothetical protein